MNTCMIIGNLTKAPEIRTTQSGTSNCTFTVAVQRRFKNANGERETDYIQVVAWRQLAELCGKYLDKGRKVAVSGSIQMRNYDKDGVKHYVTELIADNVEFLTAQNKPQTVQNGAETDEQDDGFVEVSKEELPF